MFATFWLRSLVDVARSRKERRRLAVRNRRLPQRPRLFLEPLEDRTLLTAWTPIGPAPITTGQTAGTLPVSGRVTGIAADPAFADIVYVATAGGGIWKSINATAASPTWTPLTDNLTDTGLRSGNPLPEFMGAVAETTATAGANNGNQIVYAGMGEANNNPGNFYGNGILVSTNGGISWTLTTGPNGVFTRNTVDKIVIDPSDKTGATAYAAVGSYNFDLSTSTFSNGQNGLEGNTGIYKTTNFGQTWTNMTAAAPNNLSTTDQWSDVVVDPIQQNGKTVLYAAEGNRFGAAGNGVYKSVDGGTTWQLLNGQGAVNGSEDGRISLALFDNGTTNELFVSISQKSGNGVGLYKMLKSTTGGSTFNDLTSNVTKVSNYLGKQGDYDTTLAISPNNPNYIYAGGSQTYQGVPNYSGSPLESFDGGDSWKDIATDPAGNGPHTDDHAVAFDKNGNLLDGNDGGVFKLTNPTDKVNQRWSSLNTNLNTIQFVGIAAGVDPTTNNLIIYGGNQDNGTVKYTGALGWNQIIGADGGLTQVDPNQPNIVFMAQQELALYASTTGGKPFIQITDGIKGTAPIPKFYAPYVRDASGNLYYGTNNLNFSPDGGSSWIQIGKPGNKNFNPSGKAIHAITVLNGTINGKAKNIVYVSAGNDMFVTQDALAASVTWEQINLPNGSVAESLNGIVVDPTDPTGGTAYAVVNTFTGGGKHVYYTTNFGQKWDDISGTLPNTPVWSVLVNPTDGTVYVGTDLGVYSTSKGGTSWAPFGTGLPNAQVTDMVIVASKDILNRPTNILVAGTYGRGAWATPLSDAPVVTTNATNQTVTAGQTATFTAMALANFPSISLQWYKIIPPSAPGGSIVKQLIPGATSTTLTISNVTTDLNGAKYEADFLFASGLASTSATLTVNSANAATSAANSSRAFSVNQQTVNLSATVDDASNPTDTVNEGTVTFTVENGSTVLGSVEGAVGGGTANANFALPAGLPIGNYTVAVSYADSLGNFTDGGDTSGTLTVAAAPTTTQLVQASFTPNLSNMSARETLTANVSSGSPVNSGIVTFAVANQTLSANVDGNGNATVTLTVPLLNLLAPQVINVSYTDPTQDLMASASTQTKVWQPLNLLAPSTATFGPNGEMVTMDLFGFLLTFRNGLLTEIDLGSNQLVFSYSASNQLTQVTFDGINLLA